MKSKSKTIKKTDDSVKKLLDEIFHDTSFKINDIDSYYFFDGRYVFLEFIKETELRPFDLIEKIDFDFIVNKIPNVFEFSKKAEAILIVIFFENLKEQFLLVYVNLLKEKKEGYIRQYDFDTFKSWFQWLNNKALQ